LRPRRAIAALALALAACVAPPAQAQGTDEPEISALVEETLRTLARGRLEDARRRLAARDYPGALQTLQEAWRITEDDPAIALELGGLHRLLGNPDEAARFYREVLRLEPERAAAHQALGEILARPGASDATLRAAADHLSTARSLVGQSADLARAQARVAHARNRTEDAERFYREAVAAAEPDAALRLEIGDFYRDAGRTDEARSWYRGVTGDEPAAQEAAKRLFELDVEREARRLGWSPATDARPSPEARRLVERARRMRAQGRVRDAETVFRQVLRIAPAMGMARADLGDLLRDSGRPAQAELEYLRALALDREHPEILARLGRLYLGWSADEGPRTREAAHFLARALEVRPDWAALHLELARAFQASGELERAAAHVDRFLARTEDERARAPALEIKQALVALGVGTRGSEDAPPDAPGPADGGGEPARAALAQARVWLSRGEPDAAMAALRQLPEAARTPAVLNAEARILHGANRLDAAAETLERSLRANEGQAEVHERLAVIRERQGRGTDARGHFERAEALGSLVASWHLARLDAVPDPLGPLGDALQLRRLSDAEGRLEAFLDGGGTEVYREEARRLLDSLERRRRAAIGSAGAGAVLCVVLLLALRARVYGGADLVTLVERHPDAGPAVQRVLSAIRHEVLKHNTMVLTGVADAVERGESLRDRAAWFRSTAVDALESRLRAYAAELRQLGRARGMRLNLRRRDAAFRALFRGFGALRRASRMLARREPATGGERRRLLRVLRFAERQLNSEGYEAVVALLDHLRVLRIDVDTVHGIFDRVRREPAFADTPVAPLALDGAEALPVAVQLPRTALEDILGNLMRNALQTSQRDGLPTPLRVGLSVSREVHPITGVERARLAVRDRAPTPLEASQLRGGAIEHGLGLTWDLVKRYEGALTVRDEADGWAKAVVVALPVMEMGT
jgi:tetratricopeptide (TPR) repeat protein